MMRVGIQGEPGAYSEQAARAFLGADIDVVGFRENRDVTRAVAAGDVSSAVLPVENSLAGSVTATYDAIIAEPTLQAVGHIVIPIHHCVLAIAGATLDQIRSIESHPVALAQCNGFFQAHPAIQRWPSHDTAGAARQVAASSDSSRAALASAYAAERYALTILASNVEDRDDNSTRFLILSKTGSRPDLFRGTRTMLVYETLNEPGALVRALWPLVDRQMNVVAIESRPAETLWSYRFVVEFSHTDDAMLVRDAIREVASRTSSLRHVGTY